MGPTAQAGTAVTTRLVIAEGDTIAFVQGGPAASVVTRDPRAAIVPVASCPRIVGKVAPMRVMSKCPSQAWTSDPHTFARVTRMSAPSGCGSVTGQIGDLHRPAGAEEQCCSSGRTHHELLVCAVVAVAQRSVDRCETRVQEACTRPTAPSSAGPCGRTPLDERPWPLLGVLAQVDRLPQLLSRGQRLGPAMFGRLVDHGLGRTHRQRGIGITWLARSCVASTSSSRATTRLTRPTPYARLAEIGSPSRASPSPPEAESCWGGEPPTAHPAPLAPQ